MAATVWTGRITFGLVSIPVKLFTATKSHDIHFNLLHESCKSRIRLQYYCPEHEQTVERSELIKGYEYAKGEYVFVTEEDFAKIKPESSTTLDIERFVDLSDVDPIYYERSYYLGPGEKGTEKLFALLATAMKNKHRAAIGRLLMREHEYLALVRPARGGLMIQLMFYHDEIKANEHQIDKYVKLRPNEINLAEELIENLSGEFEPEHFENEYIERLEEMLEAKARGKKVTIYKPKKKPKVTDLMEALQRSIQQTSGGKKPAARATSRETELPIEDYESLSASEILKRLDELSEDEIQAIAAYERKHKKRKTLLDAFKKRAA